MSRRAPRDVSRILTILVLAAEGDRGTRMAARIGRSELASQALLCRARGRLGAQLAAAV